MGLCVSEFWQLLEIMLTFQFLPRPDRWDNLPEAVTSLPGLYANTMTFSAGPRVRDLLPPAPAKFERSTKIKLSVVHRPALFADRDEDVHVHPNDQLCVLRDGREGREGERVCILLFIL